MSWEALKMGEYGAYVWSSYGLTFAVLLWLALYVRHVLARELKTAQRRTRAAETDSAGESNAVAGKRP